MLRYGTRTREIREEIRFGRLSTGGSIGVTKAEKSGTAADRLLLRPESRITLERVLSRIRWVTIAGLFLLAFAQPLVGRVGLPTWMLILGFAGYSAAIMWLRQRVVWLQLYPQIATLDLLVVSALYMMGASPSGPLFVLFLLITVSTSCTTTLRRSLIYTLAVLIVMTLISPTLPLWVAGPTSIRDFVARLMVVALANLGAAALMRQLEQEHGIAREASQLAQRHAAYLQAREAFVVSISHELRTPLTALRAGLGMLELSLRDRLSDDEAHLFATARRNNERLGLLVNDLLTHNQLEAHALRLEYEQLDLCDVVSRAVSAVAPLLAERGHLITVELADQLPYQGDARRLEHAIANLVANACEHTPSGTRIAVASRVTSHEVLLTVADDGPGIPDEAHERVFDPFHQLNPAGRGSGLGLAIARHIAELHGGRLYVAAVCRESAPGNKDDGQPAHGATFCLALPRQGAGESNAAVAVDRR